MDPYVVRSTWKGALAGMLLFGVVPLLRLATTGALTMAAVQPLLWFAFLGGVIGGLAGPLVGQAWRRRRG